METLSGIARPLRVFHARACLLIGRIKMAREEINELSKSPDPTSDEIWDTSKSLAYIRAQLSYLEVRHFLLRFLKKKADVCLLQHSVRLPKVLKSWQFSYHFGD